MNRRAAAYQLMAFWFLVPVHFALADGPAVPVDAAQPTPVPVWTLDFSPDGSMLAAAAGDRSGQGIVQVWNTETWDVLFTVAEKRAATCVSFAPDGATLAIGLQSGEVCTFDVATRKTLARWKSGQWAVFGVNWTPDGNSVIGALSNGAIKVWQAQSGELQIEFDVWKADGIPNTKPGGHADRNQWDVATTADGKTLFTVGWNDTTRIWSLETKRLIHQFPEEDRSTQGIQIMPDGRHFVTAGLGTGEVKIRDSVTLKERTSLPVAGRDVAVHPQGELIAACSLEKVHVYRVSLDPVTPETALRARAQLERIESGDEEEQQAAMRELKELGPVVTPILQDWLNHSNSSNATIKSLYYTIRKPVEVAVFDEPDGEIRQVVFSPKGNLLAASTILGNVQVWNTPEFTPAKTTTVTIPPFVLPIEQ